MKSHRPHLLRTTAVALPLVFLSAVAGLLQIGRAQTAALTDDAQPPHRLGLAVTFDRGDQRHTTSSRLLALHVPEGATPSPFLTAADTPWSATWRGELVAELRTTVQLHAEGAGRLIVTINGEPVIVTRDNDRFNTVSGRIELEKGGNRLEARLTSAAKGDTVLRTYWSGDDFEKEPLAPMILRHAVEARPAARRDALLETGRHALAALHCLRCHQPDEPVQQGIPEAAFRAPLLDDVGSRFRLPWLAQHIENPQHFRLESTMPRVLPVRDADAPSPDAWHIAAFLIDGPARDKPIAPPDASLSTEGQKLFLDLGCIACHRPPDRPQKEADLSIQRVRLDHVRLKYRPAALKAFLRNPQAHQPSRTMPDYQLTDEEADGLTAYLWHTAVGKLQAPKPPGPLDADRGRQLYEALGCVNCHADADDSRLEAPSLSSLQKAGATGCLAKDPARSENAPAFTTVTDEQREGMQLFLADPALQQTLHRSVPAAFATRQIDALRCAACHAYDGRIDPWTKLEDQIAALMPEAAEPEEDEGEAEFDFDFGYGDDDDAAAAEEDHVVDQSRPRLTWVGEKLQPEWMRRFIAGELDYRPRPWLRARMPKFPVYAEGLAHGLAAQHGYGPGPVKTAEPDKQLAAIGRQLVGAEGGFGCTQCHAVGEKKATSVFESQGVNFKYVRQRLRKDYFDRWVMAPARIDPQTKMPRYADDEGRSPFTDILDGDARAQYDAIWEYLKAGRSIEAP